MLKDKASKPACIAPLIDHTALKPDVTEAEIEGLCKEAIDHRFASVCVNPCWVALASELLKNELPMVCTVIGFPLGANVPEIKADEAVRAIEDGAEELDMVLNVGTLKSGKWEYVFSDVVSVVESSSPVAVKVILETCLLTDEEIVRASAICASAGAAYVKTSTGFSSGGATENAIALMSASVEQRLGVKASGGVGDFETAMKMIRAGATRIGASKSLKITAE
ncbi:MAG TPA: deoxyribose-phosphate aldolase [candidate division Zixibacteria bacterium]|nr:deoxyribose-phosphate aldolase [candidate division Zixibacteria bacterium]